jgi:hypothetical protein
MRDQSKNQEIIRALAQCINACEACASGCLNENSVQSLTDCIRTDMECADICSVTLKFIGRNSSIINELLDLCIAVCKRCAEECEKHQMDHCRRCAEACSRCVEMCNEFKNQREVSTT